MRTTIRLPDELYAQVRVRAARDGETVTLFIEQALRAALARRAEEPSAPPYRVMPLHGNGLQPGADLDDNAALVDLMDADAGG